MQWFFDIFKKNEKNWNNIFSGIYTVQDNIKSYNYANCKPVQNL
jgi:hypothetical protein